MSPRGPLFPLDAMYVRAGMALPAFKTLRPGRIPSPCRELLVTEDGMTLTLERHVGGPIAVRVLASFSRGRSYYRRVLLVAAATGRPVAMCAVRLEVEHFSGLVRNKILAERTPLGTILSESGTPYDSRPTQFFRMTPTAEMMGFFWMNDARPLYGRQTRMTVPGHTIGDIVEILPQV